MGLIVQKRQIVCHDRVVFQAIGETQGMADRPGEFRVVRLTAPSATAAGMSMLTLRIILSKPNKSWLMSLLPDEQISEVLHKILEQL